MDASEMRRRFGEAAVARLATVGPDARPYIVPICFILVGDEILFAIDHKPKRSTDLQRLRNIAANPSVAVLVDHYEDDWGQLWWVRADGRARVVDPGDDTQRAIDLLATRYAQYVAQRPDGPVVAITIERLSGWSATP